MHTKDKVGKCNRRFGEIQMKRGETTMRKKVKIVVFFGKQIVFTQRYAPQYLSEIDHFLECLLDHLLEEYNKVFRRLDADVD